MDQYYNKLNIVNANPVKLEDNCSFGQENVRSTRSYNFVPEQKRIKLIDMVLNKSSTIKEASKQLGIKIPTAKSILHIFKTEGRFSKKITKNRENNHKKSENSAKSNVSMAASQTTVNTQLIEKRKAFTAFGKNMNQIQEQTSSQSQKQILTKSSQQCLNIPNWLNIPLKNLNLPDNTSKHMYNQNTMNIINPGQYMLFDKNLLLERYSNFYKPNFIPILTQSPYILPYQTTQSYYK